MLDVDAVAVAAFGLADDLPPFVSDWHAHNRHQLLYATTGVIELRLDTRRWLLPPQKAAWITAGTQHTASSRTGALLRTVYISPALVTAPPFACRVFSVSPFAREMLLEAMRWGPEHTPSRTSEAFFTALAGLGLEWSEEDLGLHLPVTQSPELERAIQHTLAHLGEALTLDAVAVAARSSVRTLARRFQDEASTNWRTFLHQARMVRAMELLGLPETRITDVALAVGFATPGAFSEAFRAFAAETPRTFRERALARRRT